MEADRTAYPNHLAPAHDPGSHLETGARQRYCAHSRRTRNDPEMMAVGADRGVCVFHPGPQQTIDLPIETVGDLAANRREILDTVSVADFLKMHPVPELTKRARLSRRI